MLRLSRSISLAVGAGLFGLAAYFVVQTLVSMPLVQDDAVLLTEEQRQKIAEHHAYLLSDHDIDYRLVTARNLEDVNSEAAVLFERLAADIRSETGRGLLLVIDADADLVRLEIGYALEGVFPDAFAAYVEHRQMVPFFERGRVADGILATTELIVARAQKAVANAGFEDEVWLVGSGGAGATARARIGAGPSPRTAVPAASAKAASQGSPAETLAAYFEAMAARNSDPTLSIYTPESRRMLRDWVVTAAQMDNAAKTAHDCPGGTTLISANGRHAVIRYPPDARNCAPYFFTQTNDGWALDFVTMQRVLRFGRSNAWLLAQQSGHPYAFAFEDWSFDQNGFPLIER